MKTIFQEKLLLLQDVADRIARKYNWHSTSIPQFTIVYCDQANSAYINLDSRVITLTKRHMKLPIELIQFTLAHEIAHYHQEMTDYHPQLFEIIELRKYAHAFALGIGAGLTLLSYTALQQITSLTDFLIVMGSFAFAVSIIGAFSKTIYARAHEQLIECHADKMALEKLDSTELALNYFAQRTNSENELTQASPDMSSIQSMYIFLKEFVYEQYAALFSTHPTDKVRIRKLLSHKAQ